MDYPTDPHRAENLSGQESALESKREGKTFKATLSPFRFFQALSSERMYAILRIIYPHNLTGFSNPLVDSMKGIASWLEVRLFFYQPSRSVLNALFDRDILNRHSL